MIHFTLDLEPRPKQRPRFNRRSGQVFTQKETSQFEEDVRRLASANISEPLRGDVCLEVLFVHPRLKGEAKKRPERKYKATRPDLSNLIKSLEDGLEGVAFNDDAQIVAMSAEKVHAALNESAHIEVTLHELSDYSTSTILQRRQTNVGGEGRASAPEESLGDRSLTAEERRRSKEKMRESNRTEHKKSQQLKHDRQSHERSKRKLEGAIIKLKEAETQRKAEAEEKRLRALEERKRKDEEFLNRLLRGRSSRESMREDEDD